MRWRQSATGPSAGEVLGSTSVQIGALVEYAQRNGIPLTAPCGSGFDLVAVARGATPEQGRRVQSAMYHLIIPYTADEIEQQFAEQLARVLAADAGPPDCRRAIGLRCDVCPLQQCRHAKRTN